MRNLYESNNAKMLAYLTHNILYMSFDLGIQFLRFIGFFNVPFIVRINEFTNYLADENLYIVQRFSKSIWAIILYSFFVYLFHEKNLLHITRKKFKKVF